MVVFSYYISGMKTLPDFTGQKIGKWAVLKKLEKTKQGSIYLCRCDCGSEKKISATRLKNAKGCRHCATKLPVISVGYQCNSWTVISGPEHKLSKKGKQGIIYKCRCVCGFEGYQTASDLLLKKSIQCRSCGNRKAKRKIKDIVGKFFGQWKVVKKIDGQWVLCECQCPNKTIEKIKRKNLISQHFSMCKICRRKNISKSQWEGHGDISGHKWAQIKQNAQIRKLDFEITINYAWDLFQKQKGLCALSGIKIGFKQPMSRVLETGVDEGEGTASLDRIDSNIGYVENNVQWIHKDIQKMKWSYNQEYFVDICRKIVKQFD